MKVLFFGTPELTVPYLEWLIQNEEVVGVVTRPDEPRGRGMEVQPPPAKTIALAQKIPVLQPKGPWDESIQDALKNFHADVGVAVAYGRILPQPIYSIPKLGTFNIHFSLLPKYRGAAPMQWALINGDSTTGVTAFWIDEKMDSGPILYQASMDIDPKDNARSLKEKLIPLGVKVLGSVMRDLNAGKVLKKEQLGEVFFAPLLTKEMGNINWERPASHIVNLVRGVYEWPGATTYYQPKLGEPKQVKIYSAEIVENTPFSKKAGTIVAVKKEVGFVVQAKPGSVLVKEVQPEGKKRMSAWAFWQGARLQVGDLLG